MTEDERNGPADPRTIRLLLVDDHQVVLDGLELLLRAAPDLVIEGTVSDGETATQFLNGHTVDLVLTDISMPGMTGIELTEHIKQSHPDTRVILLSMHDDSAFVAKAVQAEADGYLLKNSGKEELLTAIRKVMDGGTYFSQGLVRIITEDLVRNRKIRDEVAALSERELEVLKLVCDELTTNEIAGQLFLSPKTVETHRKHILRKTGTRSAVGLIKFALTNRIIRLEDVSRRS